MNASRQILSLMLAAAALAMVPAAASAQLNCGPGFATTVVSSYTGSNPLSNAPAANALGDTPTTYFSMGNGGQLVVSFAQVFSNSGDALPDLEIDEFAGNGSNDCYWLCLYPHNAATTTALNQAGWVSFNNGTIFQVPMLLCEDTMVDIDLYAPGHAAGTLVFDALMIEDDGSGGNGAEISRVIADRICTPVTTPPCQPMFASTVVNSYAGGSNQGTPASNALGDTPDTYFSLGNGGSITVGFPVNFTTSGDSTPDIFVDEYGASDCYYVCILAANSYTNAVMLATGFNHNGMLYQLPVQFCGDALIDIDSFVPGHANGELLFSAAMVEDDGNGGNGAEVARIRVDFTCIPSPTCVPGYAATVKSSVNGTGQTSGTSPSNALGDTPNTYFNLGQNGSIAVCFSNVFTTNGGAGPDLDIDEWGVSDCYVVSLLPADAASAALLAGAGLMAQPGGYYNLPATFCGDVTIDIDQYVPAPAAHELLLSCVKIQDDNTPGDGAEIARVFAHEVCDMARIGNRVFADIDCDGIQDLIEAGVPGVTVDLISSANGQILATRTTDANGLYEFIVPAGSYYVQVSFDAQKFFLTTPNVGSNDDVDSDFAVINSRTGLITVMPNQVRTDVDAGLCIICTGVQAFVNENLPGCGTGMDPVLHATLPVIGGYWNLSIDSVFPYAPLFLFCSFGPPQHVIIPGTSCNVWLNLNNAQLLGIFPADANGDFMVTIPILPDPAIVGYEIVFQARACYPAIPGPLPGFPDWPSNAVHLIIGCP